MTPAHPPCDSCGMPIETGRHCRFCTDADGNLQAFDERFARMVDWWARREPDASRDEVEAAARAYMATMPAWREHPGLVRD